MADLDEIQQAVEKQISGLRPIEHDEIEAVLHRIQCFDPLGVAASDLRETLLIQLRAFDQHDECVKLAKKIIDAHQIQCHYSS